MDDIPLPIPSRPHKFMDRLRIFMRSKHMVYKSEDAYCFWIRDFIRFRQMRRPEGMGSAEVDA